MTSDNLPLPNVIELLSDGESELVDYKTTVDSVSADDICAFANMRAGGTFFIGVKEASRDDGSQYGRPVGCSVDDSSLLILINKAQTCHPPIQLTHHIEKLDGISFLRVQVSPSSTRPHCTPKGRYLARSGSRNVPLLPPALLTLFLEREASIFHERFAEATTHITESIAETAEAVEKMQEQIEDRISNIANDLGWADEMFDDTGDKIDRLEALITETIRREIDSASRLREIAKATSSKDPIRDRVMKQAKEAIKTAILENEEMIRNGTTGDKINIRTAGQIAEELNNEDLQSLFEEVLPEMLVDKKPKPEANEGNGLDPNAQ